MFSTETTNDEGDHWENELFTNNNVNDIYNFFISNDNLLETSESSHQISQEPLSILSEEPSFSSSTSANPAVNNWPGIHHFSISFSKFSTSTKNKKWEFSEILNKLFVDMKTNICIEFNVSSYPNENLFVRALPIFASAEFISDPVKRCPNHASPGDTSNRGFPLEYRYHLIRAEHEGALYIENPSSGRLSVLVPLENPQVGTSFCSRVYKFMCLGSDVGGINRKPVKIIYTLERSDGTVIGRSQIDVRLCSCPKRDREQEEIKFNQEEAVRIANGLSSQASFKPTQVGKKRKITSTTNSNTNTNSHLEEMVLIPVAKQDFGKLNEFAEAAMIVRNPSKASEIREERKLLLETANRKKGCPPS